MDNPRLLRIDSCKMGKQEYKFTVVIERDEDGLFVASCPALQGCHTEGNTYEEVMVHIKEAIDLSIAARLQVGDSIPEEVGTREIKVAV